MDTSFMSGVSHKDENYLSILKFCKANDIDVYISEIGKEEWRAQKVDQFEKNLKPLRTALAALKHPSLLHEIFPTPTLTIPDRDEIDKKSVSIIDNFLEQHNIKIAPIRSHHVENTWNAYFQCQEPFEENKDRSKNRTNIPDAWVYQAAFDIKKENITKTNFFILHKRQNPEHSSSKDNTDQTAGDKNLTNSLKNIGYKLKEYSDFAKEIASQESKKEEAITVLSNNELDSTPTSSTTLSDHNELHERVLATVYLLSANAPVPKVTLIEFLKEFYTPNQITATADYLAAVQEVLKKIGDGYVPRDKNLCKNAYDARLPEILRIMSRGQ
ncbi:MAG: PIN domain-containing protein [Holosporales bacterium]